MDEKKVLAKELDKVTNDFRKLEESIRHEEV
jgi:hypothetical protein